MRTRSRFPAVFEGLETVQGSGETNVLDYQAVRSIVTCIGYPEAALRVDGHWHEYSEGLFRGFAAAE